MKKQKSTEKSVATLFKGKYSYNYSAAPLQ